MNKYTAPSCALSLLFVLFVACGSGPALRDPGVNSSRAGKSPLEGTWTGTATVSGQALAATLHVFYDGALLDIPEQGLWSYPLGETSLSKDSLTFELSISGLPQAVSLALADGKLSGSFGPATGAAGADPEAPDTPAGVSGSFSFTKSDAGAPLNPFVVQTAKGPIHGEFDLVPEAKKSPLAIIVPDSGSVDRNGNILGVGGRGETYRLIAQALVAKGIACARYDKRGVAYSYPRVKTDGDLLFSDYADDLAALLAAVRADKRFSSVTLIGHGEGSLVAAAALQALPAKGHPVSFIALSPQSRPVQELLRQEVRGYGEESLAEYERVLADLLAGGSGEPLPDFLREVFTPGMLGYWKSWMRFEPEALYAGLSLPLLLVRGANETVSSPADIDRLLLANTKALHTTIPGMNQVLKEGAGDQNALYDAYLDAEQPLSTLLLDELIGFILSL